MKVSREQVEQNRASLLDAASRLYREHGFDGIGVAQIAAHAGLTHGGLYAHFDSKDTFAAEACGRSFALPLDKLDAIPDGDEAALRRFIKGYLSETHRDAPATGCPAAALGSEAARKGGEIADAMTEGIKEFIDRLAALYGTLDETAGTRAEHRARAMATFSTLLGGLILARATAQTDPRLSKQMLAAARAQIDALLVVDAGEAID